jgi:hypothetical protein
MGRLAEKVLLKEYIQEVLNEDDGGVYMDLAMADATQSPWGVSFGSNEQLYNIFVRPFVDVVQTAAGKTKELSQKGQTLVRVAFETIATTLIPVLTDSYNEIFAKDKERIDKIRQEYGEVYQSNWDAFKDEDFQFLAFCYDPARYIATKVAKKAPGAALSMVSVLTGGSMDEYIDKLKQKFAHEEGPHREEPEGGKNLGKAMGGYGGGGYDVGYGMESVIREDGEPQQEKPSLAKVLGNPKMIAQIDQGQIAQKMRKDAQGMVRQSLAQVYKQAKAVLGAKSLQDLQQKLGKKLKGVEKLNNVDPKARQAAEQQLLAGVKKSMRTFYVKSLQKQAKNFEGTPVAKDYEQIISKVNAL